ncbi:preprotein translocase subunit SecG [bacterium]|nr:preprotein translocase subunit SecG [bacterium]
MSSLITAIHIMTCLILIIAVLLQSGKSADLAGAFGGIGSQKVFGPRGAGNILSKATTVCAILFMITSMGLWILSAKGTKSVVKGEEPIKETPAVTETQKEAQEQKTPAPEPTKEEQKKSDETEKKE